MDFEISPEQEELRAAVVSVLERECPISRVRALVEQGGEPAQAWRSAVELGWPAVPVPERFGGLGLGFAEVALMVEEHGRFLAPGPFLSTVTQFVPALREAGDDAQQEQFLGAVVAGKLTGALAVASEDGALFPPNPSLRARADGDGWILDGMRHHVIDGDTADEIVVAASVKEGDSCALFLVPRNVAKTRRVTGLDATRPLATLHFDGVRIGADRTLGAPGHCAAALRRILEQATAALALEMVGTCQAIFDRTLAYAKQREQFGRPIGSFQAIQHKCADMFGALGQARATAYFAALAVAEDDDRRALATAMAKATAGDCQRLVAKEGIQIHGGIGFTWEHDIHLFVKRVKTGEALFGTAAQHRARIADLIDV